MSNATLEKVFHGVIAALIIGSAFAILYTIFGFIFTKSTIDYCYFEASETVLPVKYVRLMGHRPWDFDVTFDRFSSFEDAKAASNSIGCDIHHGR